jgi:hypothetical protein
MGDSDGGQGFARIELGFFFAGDERSDIAEIQSTSIVPRPEQKIK